MQHILVGDNIVHIGAALCLAGYLFRDQVMLRALVVLGDLVYILYYIVAPARPLWGGVFWSAVFVLANAWMMARIIADRTEFSMREEERELHGLLGVLTPGEFRRLVARGTWQVAAERTTITRENQHLARLFYVMDGRIEVEKAGKRFQILPPTFIGEVAFLTGHPASATVTVAAGARYMVWDTATLRRLQRRAPSLGAALGAALNRDMAIKVARS
jgi:hypothetical protein